MKLRELTIHNYRSIAHIQLAVPDMLVLVGPNNHGKSNIVSALEFGLSPSAKPTSEDFFSFRSPQDPSLWVEMTFGELTDQERTTFRKYVRDDQTIRVRKTASLTEGDTLATCYNGYVQEPREWWLKQPATTRLSSREQIEDESRSVPQLKALLSIQGRITRQAIFEFQSDYIQDHRAELELTEGLEEGPFLGTKNVAAGLLPDLYLIPAVRDLSEEARVKGTTLLGKLVQRAVADMTQRDVRLAEFRDQLQRVAEILNERSPGQDEEASALRTIETLLDSELASWDVRVSIEVIPPEIEKFLELGTKLLLHDGLKTPPERKGHGLQRAVLFALFRAWARILRQPNPIPEGSARQASQSVYFAVEEPELFLHPHAQRQLLQSLHDISATPDHQVFTCTHSTHFIDMERYRDIAIISKPSAETGTQIRQTTADLFEGDDSAERRSRFHMAYWVNPDRGELFFARRVILVEGETEKASLPFIARMMGCFDGSVSIIDCGSKSNLPLYMRILNAFSIPHVVIHDEDPMPDPIPAQWSDQKRREKQRLAAAQNKVIAASLDANLARIETFSPDFERVSGIPLNQGDKKGKAVAALEHFNNIDPKRLPQRLREVIQAAYNAVPTGDPPDHTHRSNGARGG